MNANPPDESQSSSRDNPCYGCDLQIAALNVIADDETSHLLAYAQFLRAERVANSALERGPSAPPEKMRLRFATADVTLLGSGLKAIERAVQKNELKFVKAAAPRFADTFKTHIAAVTIAFTKETL